MSAVREPFGARLHCGPRLTPTSPCAWRPRALRGSPPLRGWYVVPLRLAVMVVREPFGARLHCGTNTPRPATRATDGPRALRGSPPLREVERHRAGGGGAESASPSGLASIAGRGPGADRRHCGGSASPSGLASIAGRCVDADGVLFIAGSASPSGLASIAGGTGRAVRGWLRLSASPSGLASIAGTAARAASRSTPVWSASPSGLASIAGPWTGSSPRSAPPRPRALRGSPPLRGDLLGVDTEADQLVREPFGARLHCGADRDVLTTGRQPVVREPFGARLHCGAGPRVRLR